LWSELKRFNIRNNLNIQFNISELTAYFPNGSKIFLIGANDEAQIEKLRGQSYKLVVLDEAGSFRAHIMQLIEEVIEPALLDLDGTVCMIGTPNASCIGYFHEATTKNLGWSVHKWNILDNIHLPHAREFLEQKKIEHGWSENHPVYCREWLGRWVRSLDSLVYHFDTGKNVCDLLPELAFDYVCGLDLGYHDATAFVIVGFSNDCSNVFIVDEWKQSKMIASDVAEKLKALDSEFHFVKVVADTGGLGKMVVEELNRRHGMQVVAAEKTNKFEFIEHMNADFERGLIKVFPVCKMLIEEWQLLQYDNDERKKEGSQFENHLADAALYAWREAQHWTFQEKVVFPEIGSQAHWDRISVEMLKEEQAAHQIEWWES